MSQDLTRELGWLRIHTLTFTMIVGHGCRICRMVRNAWVPSPPNWPLQEFSSPVIDPNLPLQINPDYMQCAIPVLELGAAAEDASEWGCGDSCGHKDGCTVDGCDDVAMPRVSSMQQRWWRRGTDTSVKFSVVSHVCIKLIYTYLFYFICPWNKMIPLVNQKHMSNIDTIS